MFDLTQLTIEHKILIVLYVITYFGAMFIQIADPKADVKWYDWPLALMTSFVGGMITYLGLMHWESIGLRLGLTIFATLVAYRTIKFIVSSEAQDDFTKGFWSGIKSLVDRIFNNPPKSNDETNT